MASTTPVVGFGRWAAPALVLPVFLSMLMSASPGAAAAPLILANYELAGDIQQFGLQAGPPLGVALAAVGDLDGNGSVDIAIGASGDDDGGESRGAVLILFMDGSSVVSTAKISAAAPPLATLLSDGDRFGSSVAAIGDIDGDGIVDLAIGAPGNDDGAIDAGAVWIVTLTASGAAKGVRKLSAASAGVAAQYDSFGFAVAAIGDLDDNGVVDLAIGAPHHDVVDFNAGAVWICLLDEQLDFKEVQRLGDDGSGFASQILRRAGFGGVVTSIGEELFVTALGDGSNSFPPPVSWAFRLEADGTIEQYRQVLPAAGIDLVPDGDIETFGDYDFDGVDDLIASTTTGLHILLMKATGEIRESMPVHGQWPHALQCCGSQANFAVVPDSDDNVIPEIVASAPLGGKAWMLRLNGSSAENAACGDPTGEGIITVADALHVLRAAVRLRFCEPLWCDVNQSGSITAADALSVLRRAIVSDGALVCPTTTSTTSTTYIYYDECFSDDDCDWDPEAPHCCYFSCCQCFYNEHCGEDEVCLGERCRSATCIDQLINGDETDTDCGGSCLPCHQGSTCASNADCVEESCVASVCQPPTCTDSARNGQETGTDCGGGLCPACDFGEGCETGSDCISRICRQYCEFATCDDRTRNGSETGMDCGGNCAPCGNGKACAVASDCTSAVCLAEVCQVPTCGDFVQNGKETGIDCGGACGECSD